MEAKMTAQNYKQNEQNEHIRVLGKSDQNGKLLTPQEFRNNKNTKLVEIELKDIQSYLYMIYFFGFSDTQVQEIIRLISDGLSIKLRESTDKRGRKYWWRPFKKILQRNQHNDQDNWHDSEDNMQEMIDDAIEYGKEILGNAPGWMIDPD